MMIEKFEFRQIYYLVGSLHTFHENFGINFSAKDDRVPEKYISKIFNRILDVASQSQFEHLCKVTSYLLKLFPDQKTCDMNNLRKEIIDHPSIPDSLKTKELSLFIQNFPKDAYLTSPDLIKKHARQWERSIKEFTFDEKVNGLIGLHRAKYEISQKVFEEFLDLDPVDVDLLSSKQILGLIEILAEYNQLTDFISEPLFEW